MTLEELKKTHWATLKKMVEDAGGQYEDKDKSIQFLVDAGAVTDVSEDTQEVDVNTVNDSVAGDIPMVKIDQPAAKATSKAMVMIDKSRPFGEIFGEIEGYPTARYSQGEHLFNSLGEKL